MKYTILIADDEEMIRRILAKDFEKAGYSVLEAGNGKDACALVQSRSIDLVILDVRMPGYDGLQCLQIMRRSKPFIPAIIMTAYANIENAVLAMKYGADDYIGKPFDSCELIHKADALLKTRQLKKDTKQAALPNLIGNSPHMNELHRTIEKLQNSNATILLTGESGTGKSAVAKEIHNAGRRSGKPFIHVDCAALPENLIDDELFGHERGAFTGAIGAKQGKFEQAQDGDLFLDEIGNLPLSLQSKLLNVLQERYYYRLGGSSLIQLPCRIIAATNEDLATAVKEGRFRKDLYYRLNVVEIHCMPLRYRKEDIRPLAEYYFKNLWNKNRQEPFGMVSDEVYNIMMNYDWPGNVRELENVIESIVVLSESSHITPECLPAKLLSKSPSGIENSFSPGASSGLSLKEQEMMLIIETLEKNNGNRTNTAKELGISRRTLQYRLKEIQGGE